MGPMPAFLGLYKYFNNITIQPPKNKGRIAYPVYVPVLNVPDLKISFFLRIKKASVTKARETNCRVISMK